MPFQVGDAVRTRARRRPGHTRLPGYLAGRHGEIEVIVGRYPFPDERALGLTDAEREVLYTVRFEATIVGFAYDGAIFADLFESYLEHA